MGFVHFAMLQCKSHGRFELLKDLVRVTEFECFPEVDRKPFKGFKTDAHFGKIILTADWRGAILKAKSPVRSHPGML